MLPCSFCCLNSPFHSISLIECSPNAIYFMLQSLLVTRLCLRSPRLPPSSMICQADSLDSAYCHTHGYSLFQKNHIKQNEQKEEHVMPSRGNWAQGSQRPLSAESHWMYSILSATRCDNTCEMLCIRKSHQTRSAQGFNWGLFVQASFVQHIPKCQIPRRKISVQGT